jgi:hypothetical protein
VAQQPSAYSGGNTAPGLPPLRKARDSGLDGKTSILGVAPPLQRGQHCPPARGAASRGGSRPPPLSPRHSPASATGSAGARMASWGSQTPSRIPTASTTPLVASPRHVAGLNPGAVGSQRPTPAPEASDSASSSDCECLERAPQRPPPSGGPTATAAGAADGMWAAVRAAAAAAQGGQDAVPRAGPGSCLRRLVDARGRPAHVTAEEAKLLASLERLDGVLHRRTPPRGHPPPVQPTTGSLTAAQAQLTPPQAGRPESQLLAQLGLPPQPELPPVCTPRVPACARTQQATPAGTPGGSSWTLPRAAAAAKYMPRLRPRPRPRPRCSNPGRCCAGAGSRARPGPRPRGPPRGSAHTSKGASGRPSSARRHRCSAAQKPRSVRERLTVNASTRALGAAWAKAWPGGPVAWGGASATL